MFLLRNKFWRLIAFFAFFHLSYQARAFVDCSNPDFGQEGDYSGSLFLQSITINDALYNTLGTIDREILPNIETESPNDSALVVHIESKSSFAVWRRPQRAVAKNSDDQAQCVTQGPTDLWSNVLAFGYKFKGPWGLFASVGISGADNRANNIWRVPGRAVYNPPLKLLQGFFQFISGRWKLVEDGNIGFVDFVGGAFFNYKGWRATLGLSTAEGIYLETKEPYLGLSFSAGLTGGFNNIGYIRSGFKKTGLQFGDVSIFFKHYLYLPPALPEQVEALEAAGKSLPGQSFDKFELGYLNIFDFVDVLFDFYTAPGWGISFAGARIHTANYHANKPKGWILAASGGYLTTPDISFYSQKILEGYSLKGEIGGGFEAGKFILDVSYNESETLSVFPYAWDSWEVRIYYSYKSLE